MMWCWMVDLREITNYIYVIARLASPTMNNDFCNGTIKYGGSSCLPTDAVTSNLVAKHKLVCETACGECSECVSESCATAKRARSCNCDSGDGEDTWKKDELDSKAAEKREEQVQGEKDVANGEEKDETNWENQNASASDCTDTETDDSAGTSPVSGSSCSSISLPSSLEIDAEFALDFAENAAENGMSPREILRELLPPAYFESLPKEWPDGMLWRLVDAVTTPRRRALRSDVRSFTEAVSFLRNARRILVVSGAGISVNAGVPDFRSPRGVYATIRQRFPETFGSRPESLFDINAFRRDPRPFFAFAREILPGTFKPTLAHAFLKLLEERGTLLRNYSQNIDMLESSVYLERIVHCHGSFATASCQSCSARYPLEAYRGDVERGDVPHCPLCVPVAGPSATPSSCDDVPIGDSRSCETDGRLPNIAPNSDKDTSTQPDNARGVLKPDIVFFGESLPNDFYDYFEQDRSVCDLLIVIGSSMKVRPVALIPNAVGRVPQILINNEPLLNSSCAFDVELIGDCDVVCAMLAQKLLELDDEAKPCANRTETPVAHEAEQLCESGVIESRKLIERVVKENEFIGKLVETASQMRMDEIEVDFDNDADTERTDDPSTADGCKIAAGVNGTAYALPTDLNDLEAPSVVSEQTKSDMRDAQIDAFLETVPFDRKYVHVRSDERRYFFKGCSNEALRRSCRRRTVETLFALASDSPNSSSDASS